MSAKIRHLALYTENHDRVATFYQKVFGMKRITKSFNDPNRGNISDGVIGLDPISIRFASSVQQTLKMHALETPIRIDALWLSATQTACPDPKSTGPAVR
jgi:catechol 2,3-dioxygenase-like lactoylglutathione lyase family enzyme